MSAFGVTLPQNLRALFNYKETKTMALPAGDDLFSRFVTMPACDGQTNVRLSAANSIELLL